MWRVGYDRVSSCEHDTGGGRRVGRSDEFGRSDLSAIHTLGVFRAHRFAALSTAVAVRLLGRSLLKPGEKLVLGQPSVSKEDVLESLDDQRLPFHPRLKLADGGLQFEDLAMTLNGLLLDFVVVHGSLLAGVQ